MLVAHTILYAGCLLFPVLFIGANQKVWVNKVNDDRYYEVSYVEVKGITDINMYQYPVCWRYIHTAEA